MLLILFKLIHGLNFGCFLYFISDHHRRKKITMIPLASPPLTVLLKIARATTGLIYMYLLIFKKYSLMGMDAIYLLCVLMGTLIVVKSKLDLKTAHAWAGFRLKKPELVTNGIYSRIRHPIYTGIFFFVCGAFATTASFASRSILMLYAPAVIYILLFLPFIARRETEMLEHEFGEMFRNYRQRTHAFWPF